LPPEAPIIATLFLNFWFYFSAGQLPLSLVDALLAPLLIPALFFVGPAFASRGTGLFPKIQSSFGTVPGYAIRLCAIVYLTIWMAVG